MASAPTVTPPIAFNTAFERLKEVVSKDDARSFNSTTMEDVWTTARDIERHLESRRSLRGFRRIQPFLAGIEQYSKIVEVICNGTPYMPYIWAPIKLLLQIAQGHIAALERLIDAYAMIGEAMPRFDRLSNAFKDDPEFQQVMSHFYEDILEFHRRAYMFFRRRAWKIVFDSLWKTFNLRFQGILENLRRHRDLIDLEANAIDIAEARAWRSTQLDYITRWREERAYEIEKAERERLASQTKEAVAWFGANEGQEDIFAKFSKACDGSVGHWIFQESSIISWLGQGGRDESVIWLNGKPGAGKSVICSKIIEHVQDKTDMTVIYYFCPHHQVIQTQSSEILRNFATQLLAGNASLAPYILDTFANNGQKPTKKNMGTILEKMITSLPSLRIVVDGLDECLQDDQEEIMQDLLKIRGSTPGACKLLLSSRKHRSMSRWLQPKPTIRLDDSLDNINSTISSFITPQLQSLRDRFSPNIVDELGKQLLAKANGMFLWIRLVMFTLADLNFESDLHEAIETLPEDLGAVYERILLRLCGDGKTINQRIIIRILQWMLVTKRPLRRCELESGITLHGQVSQITAMTRPRGDVLSLCYPILEAEEAPGGFVTFVHFTVLEYLTNTQKLSFLQPQRAQLTVSLSCILYLHSGLDFVDPRISEDEKRSNVALCLHEMHLYAIDHWIDHLLALLKSVGSPPGGCELEPLLRGIERLTVIHNHLAALQGLGLRPEGEPDSTQREHRWQFHGISPPARTLLDKVLDHRQIASLDDSKPRLPHPVLDEDQDPTLFSRIRVRYQTIVEELIESEEPANSILINFKERQTSGAFLCGYRKCPRAAQGFNTAELRQKHEESHRLRFQCAHASCGFFGSTFITRAAMKQHAKKYHGDENTASVPDSLPSKRRRSREDRSLFTFAEVKTKRRGERFSPPKEFEIATDVTDPSLNTQTTTAVQTTAGSVPSISAHPQDTTHMPSDEDIDYIIKCICGFQWDDGNTVYCDLCDTWQHTECYYIDKHGNVATKEELEVIDHFCVDCQPRSLNYKGAVERQRIRQKELNLPMAQAVPSSQPRQQTQGSTVSPRVNALSGLSQVANTNQLTTRSASPALNISQQGWPFRESSQSDVERDYSNLRLPADRPPDISPSMLAAHFEQVQRFRQDSQIHAQDHLTSRPTLSGLISPSSWPTSLSPLSLTDHDPQNEAMVNGDAGPPADIVLGENNGDLLLENKDDEVPGAPLGGNFAHGFDVAWRAYTNQIRNQQEQERATQDLERDTDKLAR